MSRFVKDPDSTLDYDFDWSAWLDVDETIVSHEIITDDSVTVDESSEDAGTVTVWLSGPQKGTRRVTCRITTSQGRVDDRSITLHVTDR